MTLFGKKNCTLCGGKTDIVLRQKLTDGFLCSECMRKLSSLSDGWREKSTADVRTHILQREANRAKYAQFASTDRAGKNSELMVDKNHRLFCFAIEKDYKDGNPEVFDFSQLTDFWLEEVVSSAGAEASGSITDISEIPENVRKYIRRDSEVFTPANGCSIYISALKAHFAVKHPYISEVTFYVDNAVARNNRAELMQAYGSAAPIMLLCEQVRLAAEQMPSDGRADDI